MTEQFVIMTRYQKSPTIVVRHVYGPYPTRAKAQSAINKMKREHIANYGDDALKNVEVHALKLLPDSK
jgi:hypothetical protein